MQVVFSDFVLGGFGCQGGHSFFCSPKQRHIRGHIHLE